MLGWLERTGIGQLQKKGQCPLEGCRHDKAKGIDAIREVSPEMAEDHDKAERQ